MPLAKREYAFFLEYIQEKTHTHILANKATWKGKSVLQRSLAPSGQKGHAEKSVKTRNAGPAMEKWEPCYADGRDVNCQQPLWRSVRCVLKPKKHSLESIGHFHSWAYKLGKLKISKTQALQSLGLLC